MQVCFQLAEAPARGSHVERDLKGLVFQEARRSQGSPDTSWGEEAKRVGQKLHEDRGISPAIARL